MEPDKDIIEPDDEVQQHVAGGQVNHRLFPENVLGAVPCGKQSLLTFKFCYNFTEEWRSIKAFLLSPFKIIGGDFEPLLATIENLYLVDGIFFLTTSTSK